MTRKLTVVVFTAALAVAASRPGDFRPVGPGGGGAQFNPAISPHDANTVLVACDMTGSYITRDGGASWRMFNLRGVTRFFVFDPVDAKTIYAQGNGLWRSTDSGESWRLVQPKPSSVKTVAMSDDHADERIVADDPVGRLTALAIDPSDSRTLFAAAVKDNKAAVWISKDGGDNWQHARDLQDPGVKIWIAPGSPRSDRSIYIAGRNSVTRRTRGEWQQFPAPSGARFVDVTGGFLTVAGDPQLFAVSNTAFYASTDGGATWKQQSLPGSGARLRAVATSLSRPTAVYVSYSGLKDDAGRWFGVAKTTDGGSTWTLPWKETDGHPGANVHGGWIPERFGPGWPESPLNMAVAPTNPDVLFETDMGRTMRTLDGGKTWDAVYSKKTENGWMSTGLDVTTTYGYHIDPFDSKRHFITYTDIGLFRSEDGGRSWMSSTQGVPPRWVNTTYWIEFDPDVRGRVWGVMSYVHDLPRPKMWRRSGVGRYNGGVCRSDDGGRTWTVTSNGLPATAPTHIVLDPKSPRSARTLYVAAFGRGVYKSTDGGNTWTEKNNGITQTEPFAWRITRTADGTLYLIVARRSDDGSIGNSGDGALYRSTDGAEHWTPVPLPSGVNGPNGLAIDARDSKRLYLAAWARNQGTHGEGGGVYLSTDAGQTWKPALERDQHVYDVTTDPRDPNVLYACGFESSAWRSADRGEHWSRIAGYNFKWGHRVAPDPADRNKVYIMTFGGSVWHGRIDGKPALLDIATPEMEPGK